MESPGTAPGSEPRIMGAFIAIFLVAQNMFNIGVGRGLCKRLGAVCRACFLRALSVHTKILGCKHEKARTSMLRGPFGWLHSTLMPDQNPALMSSNSASMRSRISVAIGTCGSRVEVIGLTPAASSAAGSSFAMPASLEWA